MVGQCGYKSADLRAFQTPFRSQGNRDTCTVFATTAALEAAYKRIYGLELDLSEQFFNKFQKTQWLDTNALLPLPEIQPENNAGGNIEWQIGVLGRYGLPPESTLPYIGDGRWERLWEWTSPIGGLVMVNQRLLDDVMLSAVPVTYSTPTPLTTTVLPQAALENARYRPTSARMANSSERTNLAWFKAQLNAGREIAFLVDLSGPDPNPYNDIWDPGPNYQGQHAMLIVGYDDRTQSFLVKNSWGNTKFDLFSYSWVTEGRVREAATILDVADPYTPFGTFENKHLFLGRWNLDFDGWKGDLDIYRLPGDGSENAQDLRIGTYFGPDGIARRVNGLISGNRLDFYIDWNNPNMPSTARDGRHFVTFIYGAEHTSMAGLMVDYDGNQWSVTAQKGRWVTGIPRVPTALSYTAYVGHWQLDMDGVTGDLAINTEPNGVITGTWTSGGQMASVVGQVNDDPRIFSLTIRDNDQYTYSRGYLNGHALGVMAGYAYRNGSIVGFHGSRTGDL